MLLVYYKKNIYDEETIVLLKKTNKNNYEFLLDECNKLTKVDSPKEKPLTEEEKRRNYNELLLAQINYERANREKNYGKENDDFFNFQRNNEKDYIEELRKKNIDNELEKIKSNNKLQSNKTNKTNSKVSKFLSVDQKDLESKRSTISNLNKQNNRHNVGNSNINP